MKSLRRILLLFILVCIPVSAQAKTEQDISIQESKMARKAQVGISNTSYPIWRNVSKEAVSTKAELGDLPTGVTTLYQNNKHYFNIQFATSQIKISKVELWVKTPNASSYSLYYTDSASAGKIITYKSYAYNFSTIGTYTYYWRLTYSTGETYTIPDRSVSVVAKKNMAVSSSSYKGTYDGYSHTIPISVSGPSSYRIYYSTSTSLNSSNYSSAGSTTKPTRTSVGETKVYFYIKDLTGDYKDFSDYWHININKANMSVTASSYSGKYNGVSHTISLRVSKPSSYKIYYSTSKRLTSSNYDRYGKTTKPTRKSKGTTTVYYYIKDYTGNYNDHSGNKSITIKAALTEKDKLIQKVTAKAKYPIIQTKYEDFDKDGKKELFAIANNKNDDLCTGELWFASSKEVKLLRKKDYQVYRGCVATVSNGKKLFLAEFGTGGPATHSVCYYVSGGYVKTVDQNYQELTHASGNKFYHFVTVRKPAIDFKQHTVYWNWTGNKFYTTANPVIKINITESYLCSQRSTTKWNSLIKKITKMKKKKSSSYPNFYATGNSMTIGVRYSATWYKKQNYVYIKNTGNKKVTFLGVSIGDSKATAKNKLANNGFFYRGGKYWWGDAGSLKITYDSKGKVKTYTYICAPTS